MVEAAEIESASRVTLPSSHSQAYLMYSQISKVATKTLFLCSLRSPLIPTVGLSPIQMRYPS